MADLNCGLTQLYNVPTKERKLCIETLIKIYRNVTANPDEKKYRTLKLKNKRFLDEVWRHEGAQIFMLTSGWVLLDDAVQLPDDEDISEALNFLIENRDVKPDEKEWVESNKIMGQNETKLREEQLREKAMQEKKKEMAKLKKDLAERKAIAERIVREHRNDRENKRTDKPSVAVPRGDGKTSKMADMIPKGGGG